MMRKARKRAEGDQKGMNKATRARKAGVHLFTALEPSLDSNPILHMRQEAFGPNELEDCGCAYLLLCFYSTFLVRVSLTQRSWAPWLGLPFTSGILTAMLLGKVRHHGS
eukprot:6180510-Pleurochrysis_carterae.AAC.1